MNETRIMGVINITPDSFSDGGKHLLIDQALLRAKILIEQGCDIIDIGGESSRPGAKSITLKEELQRTVPIIKAIRQENSSIIISIDTTKEAVMKQALENGATMVNDISALSNVDSIKTIVEHNCQICIMHMQGTPLSMQNNPKYNSVVSEVFDFLEKKVYELANAGISTNKIFIDPGFGFGKTLDNNIELFKKLPLFKKLSQKLGCAGVLIGVSRKSMIGKITNIDVPSQRIIGSVSAALIAMKNNIDIVRVHDVTETVQAFKVFKTLSY